MKVKGVKRAKWWASISNPTDEINDYEASETPEAVVLIQTKCETNSTTGQAEHED